MATSRIAETPLVAEEHAAEVLVQPVAKIRGLSLLRALLSPIGILAGLLISTFPLSAPVLYVIALLLVGK